MRKLFILLTLLIPLLSLQAQTEALHQDSRAIESNIIYGVRGKNYYQQRKVSELLKTDITSPGENIAKGAIQLQDSSIGILVGDFILGNYYAYGTMGPVETGPTAYFSFLQISVPDWKIVNRTRICKYMDSPVIGGMVYDYETDILIANEINSKTETSNLMAVNLNNGERTLITAVDKFFVTIAITDNGALYGISIAGDFCSIDKKTGASTVVRGGFGPINTVTSMTYDNINQKFIWADFEQNANITTLIAIDPITGESTELGPIEGSGKLTGIFSGGLSEEIAPAHGEELVDVFTEIKITFNDDITANDLSSIKFEPAVTGLTPRIKGNVLTIAHDNLDYSTEYTVYIPGNAIKGVRPMKWSFTTLPDPGICNVPAQLTIEELNSYDALVSWRETGAGLSWDIKFGTKGFDVESEGTLISGLTEKTHRFSDLDDATEYDFYVRAVCYADEVTEWSAVKSFRTPMDCDKPYTSFPWTEGFEEEIFPLECWTRFDYDTTTVGNEQWMRNTNFKRTGNASAAHVFHLNKPQEGWLVTRKFRIPSGADTYVLRFWNMNRFADTYVYNGVWISEGSPDPEEGDFVEVWTPLTVTETWKEEKVNLSEMYAGKDIYIAFKYVSAGKPNGITSQQWYIDDLLIDTYNYTDIQLISIDQPVRGGAKMPADQEVKVTLYNYGSEPLIDIPITLKVNGTIVAEETITEEVHSLATYQYTFKKKIDLSQPGAYNIEICVDIEDDQNPENNKKSKEILRIADEYLTIYGYSILSYPILDNTFISFNTEDVLNTKFTELAKYTAGRNMVATAGEYLDGYFYMFAEDSVSRDKYNFIKIDTRTWTEVFKKEVTVSAREMTFDYSTNTMYIVTSPGTGNSDLYTVDIKTGATKFVTSLTRYLFGMACDLGGQIYGVSTGGDFCKVDKTTGEVELIRNTGYTHAKYIQSMAFDHNTGRLFWAMVGEPTPPSIAYGGFMELDKTTGYAHFYGRIWINTEIIGLYIPYDRGVLLDSYTPTGTDVALDAEVSVEFNVNITAEELSRVTITPDPGSVSATIEGNKIVIAHAPFAGETEYTVTVPAGTIAGYDEVVSWKFTTTKGQGIAQGEGIDVRLYPNPSTGVVYVTVPENSTIKVFDLSGRMVEEVKGQSKDITLTLDVADGIYFIQVESNGSRVSRKLIIRK